MPTELSENTKSSCGWSERKCLQWLYYNAARVGEGKCEVILRSQNSSSLRCEAIVESCICVNCSCTYTHSDVTCRHDDHEFSASGVKHSEGHPSLDDITVQILWLACRRRRQQQQQKPCLNTNQTTRVCEWTRWWLSWFPVQYIYVQGARTRSVSYKNRV